MTATTTLEIKKLKPAKLQAIQHDPVKTAKAISLKYVSDKQEGIRRYKRGKNFTYAYREEKLTDTAELARIKSLVIPPAWQDVWICKMADGHLQVTGTDAMKRKQYRYHPLWNEVRSQTKFFKMYYFGQALPTMRLQLEKDLASDGLNVRRVLAAIVSLMERTHIRVGNTMYEKLYGSYGLTTLKDKHVEIKNGSIKFQFVGKKGVKHNISLKNKKLSKIVQNCKDIPGKDLFQYYDDNGNHHCVDSGMVNDYIKEISGGENYTAKDFRTWAGSVEAIMALHELGEFETQKEGKEKTVTALDKVSDLLGNTRTVCKKYYVHPHIINLYENKSLSKYLSGLDKIEKNDNKAGLTKEEKILMEILAG